MKKYIYVWLLPLVWSVCSFLSFQFPGDEYMLYGISSIIGTWVVMVIDMPGDIHHPAFWMSITATGAIIMALIGLGMSVLRVKIKLLLILQVSVAAILFMMIVASYPSIEKALSKNGSWFAYIFSSLNMGLYVAVILSGIITGIIRIVQKKKTVKDAMSVRK